MGNAIGLIFGFWIVGDASALTPQEAIKAQVGCYEVTFQYKETEALQSGYQLMKPKKSTAIEWVVVEEDRPDYISLQHILVSGPAMIKHWRQVWSFEATNLWHYKGDRVWEKKIYSPEEVAGKWAQKVYNVDDALRYECIAFWQNSEVDNSWSCTTGAPLPRREKKRKDYNILERTNVHRINDTGWVHEQFNTKINIENGKKEEISKEEGYNTYVKIDDAQCKKAIEWWPKRRATWKVIQRAWTDFYQDRSQLTLKKSHWGLPIWIRLFKLAGRDVRKPKQEEKVYREALRNMESYLIETK